MSAGLTFQSGSEKDNAEDNKRRAVVCGCAHSGARARVNRVEARATKEGFPLPYSRRRVQSSEPGSGFFFFFLNAFKLGQQTATESCRAPSGYALLLVSVAFELFSK